MLIRNHAITLAAIYYHHEVVRWHRFVKPNITSQSCVVMMAFVVLLATGCRKEKAAIQHLSPQSNINTEKFDPSLKGTAKTVARYGALIGAPANVDPYQFTIDVAGAIGLSCIRDKAPVPGTKKVKMLTSGYKVLLNFTTCTTMPMRFRTDLSTYQNDLRNTLSVFTTLPTVAVIENEESNSQFYNGTPLEYVNQLQAAISVMHANHIPVANGGITSVGLEYLVYQDYLSRGMTNQAEDFRQRMNVAINSSFTIDRANFISILLANYAIMDLDYVNFHWRSTSSSDSEGLGETIAYLKRVTGKPVITNEIGQYDQDPATLNASVGMCKSYQLPYVLWYSKTNDSRSFPLQYDTEALTVSGEAYKSFLAAN